VNMKELIVKKKLRQWEVAEELGISEFTLSRWLRRADKLTIEKRKDIEAAIERVEKRGLKLCDN